MASDSLRTVELGYCLVTGGAGFLGRHLAAELLRRGLRVRVFDRRAGGTTHERLDVLIGDLRDPAQVRAACDRVDTVFHTAALLCFLRFPIPEEREASVAVNVGGVQNVLRACRGAGVRRLIHTSTNNVTFGGPVIDGDETWPYAGTAKDLYTQTKILGEQTVLEANGRDRLLTCAIRPGGIYGPGDAPMLPRLVEQCVRGHFVAIIGDGSAKSDNTFIDNLVDAQIEAARYLTPQSPLGGQAYFITDGVSLNYFEFFRPLVAGMGFPFPSRHVPAWPLYAGTWLWELAHRVLRVSPPELSHLEIRKIAVSHYSRIEKAKRDFGWEPKVSLQEAMARCLPHCRKLVGEVELADRPAWYWWVLIPTGMGLTALLTLSPAVHGWWSTNITTWTPRWLLGGIFVWAALVHARKGIKAMRLARQAGLAPRAVGWGWQTFLLGFPSLGLLEKKIAADRVARGDTEPARKPRPADVSVLF